MSRRALALAVAVSLAAACSGGDDAAGIEGPIDDLECPAPTIVYLNRNGGTFQNGLGNSVTDSAVFPQSGDATISPFGGSDEDWQATVECFEDLVRPYNFVVTDEDPGDVDHLEIVMSGGDSSAIGITNGDQVFASAECPTFNRRGLAFTFVNDPEQGCLEDGLNVQQCYAGGFALGFMIGLLGAPPNGFEDEVMQFACFSKFHDFEYTCGSGGDIPFACGLCRDQSTQNSHDAMIAAFGPACSSL